MTKCWLKINDPSSRTYNVNSQNNFKTSMFLSSLCDYSDAYILVSANMLLSSLCDYSDAYILVSANITVPNTGTAANANNRKKYDN